MLRLTFKISRSTDLPVWTLVDNTVLELITRNYRILNSTSSIVEFDNSSSSWKPTSRFETMSRFDGGKLKFSSDDKSVLVTFSYYLNILWPVIFFTTMSIFLIIDGEYYGPLFPLVFYVIAITINIAMLKGNANKMLDEILN